MQKEDLQMIIFNIKAAVRLGTADSLWHALDLFFNLPEIACNEELSPAFIEKTLLPIGKAMVGSTIPAKEIKPLGKAPNAAARALTAVCLSGYYMNGGQVGIKDLSLFGQDRRDEVRLALMLALRNQDVPQLIEAWQSADSPRLQEIAAQLS